jgi:hypothetical protein
VPPGGARSSRIVRHRRASLTHGSGRVLLSVFTAVSARLDPV